MVVKSVSKPGGLTVDHEEEDGSPREAISLSSFLATRNLICAWPNRIELAIELLGGVVPVGSDSRQVALTLPHQYPHQEGVFCTAVTDVTGLGSAVCPNTQIKVYNKARLTVEYEAPTINIGGELEPVVEESLEPSAEFLTVSNEDLFWDSSGAQPVAIDDSPAVQVRFIEWVFSIKNLPVLPPATLNIGFVNVATITSVTLGMVFPPETLLYSSVLPRRVIFGTVAGAGGLASGWDVTYRFTHNPGGWNKFRRGPLSTPQQMYRQQGGSFVVVAPYPTMDFTAITGIIYGQ